MLPWIMWEWNCNMENQCGTSFSGNLYQINYCEGGTRDRSIVWLGVITNVTIDCAALSSRHWGILCEHRSWLYFYFLPFGIRISIWTSHNSLVCGFDPLSLSSLVLMPVLGFTELAKYGGTKPLPRPGGTHIQMEPVQSWKLEEDKEEKFSF